MIRLGGYAVAPIKTLKDFLGVIMRFCSLPAILALLCVLASPVARAERATNILALPNDSRIHANVTNEDARQNLVELGRKWDRKLGIACEEDYRIRIHPAHITVLKPIEFPDVSKYPVDGVWQYRFELTRCGSAKIYNALVAAGRDAPPRYSELLPGRTLSPANLMRDVLRTVYMKVTIETRVTEKMQCDDFVVKDTSLTVVPRIATTGVFTSIASPYEEAWIVRYCGKDISVPLCFAPKPGGGVSFLPQSCNEAG